MISEIEIIKRLILATIVGGLIGMEREVNNRPAGLRTHILVSLGSALIMLVSIDGFYGIGDPARLASQVVSGIGFLGAGTIMRTGNNINGLTTAASLWVSAGIGLAMGSGYYLGAIVTSIVVLISLTSLGFLEKKIAKKKYRTIEIVGSSRPGLIGNIGSIFGKYYISIKDISIVDDGYEEEDEGGGIVEAKFLIKMPNSLDFNTFYNEIYQIHGVSNIFFDGKRISKNNMSLINDIM